MINKSYKFGYLTVIILCVIAMGVGAKFDYLITDTLYSPTNAFGILFEAFAYLPIYLFVPFFGGCLMIRNQNKAYLFIFGLMIMLCSLGLFGYVGAKHLLQRNFIGKINPYLCGIFSGLLSAFLFIFLRKLKKSSLRKIQSLCSFALFYLMGETALIFAVKKICGRDRYEDIITGGNFAFADWFRPVFFSEGSSFPSGHVGAAMGIMTLLLLPFLFKAFQKRKLPLFIFCYYIFFWRGAQDYSQTVYDSYIDCPPGIVYDEQYKIREKKGATRG
ncbi:MAG: hypothetical protein RR198_01910, partial [Oscillospiraceae bacterium]